MPMRERFSHKTKNGKHEKWPTLLAIVVSAIMTVLGLSESLACSPEKGRVSASKSTQTKRVDEGVSLTDPLDDTRHAKAYLELSKERMKKEGSIWNIPVPDVSAPLDGDPLSKLRQRPESNSMKKK